MNSINSLADVYQHMTQAVDKNMIKKPTGIIQDLIERDRRQSEAFQDATTPENMKAVNHAIEIINNDPCDGCDGYKMSDCCGAWTDTDILICSDCKEHCGVQCDECEDKK